MQVQTVGAIMSPNVVKFAAERPLAEAVTVMGERAISCVLIVDGERPVGVVSERDVLRRVVATTVESLLRALPGPPNGRGARSEETNTDSDVRL